MTFASTDATSDASATRTVGVELGERTYDVLIGPGLLAKAGALIAERLGKVKCAIVTDENVAHHHLAALERSLTAAGLAVCGELLSPLALCTLLFAAFASTEVLQKAYLARREKLRDSAWTWAGALALYGVCVLNVASSGFTPFLYFQF